MGTNTLTAETPSTQRGAEDFKLGHYLDAHGLAHAQAALLRFRFVVVTALIDCGKSVKLRIFDRTLRKTFVMKRTHARFTF
jgi:hypothetical protein